jgi:YegS/Rv2252/BmrU family lipid kinase
VTTALLIRNPVARRRLSEAQLASIKEVALEAGWTLDIVATACAGDATRIAKEAAGRGVDVVIVHGGDGTLNEAINGLAGTETAVAVLRGGTANVWAKETKCAKDPVRAMRSIVTGERRRIDLGRAGDRYFLLMCGVGLDARIVNAVGSRIKRWLGAAAYMLVGVAQALRTETWHVDMTIDNDSSEPYLYFLLVSNTRLYGGITQITHRAVADDGELDVALMRRGGVVNLLRDGVRVLFRRHDRSPNVRFGRARTVDIKTSGIPVQVDGEAAGTTPVRIEVAPLALSVIVPAGLQSPLFGREQPGQTT